MLCVRVCLYVSKHALPCLSVFSITSYAELKVCGAFVGPSPVKGGVHFARACSVSQGWHREENMHTHTHMY